MDEGMDGWTSRTAEWIDGLVRLMDGLMDAWIDGQIDVWIHAYNLGEEEGASDHKKKGSSKSAHK